MPVAAERALERAADQKGLKGEDKDRFVYGVLRHKFGWRPRRELDKSDKRMSNLSALTELNARLDQILQFDQTPENNTRRGVGIGLLGGGLTGAIRGKYDADRFANRGLVYKKRDALGHSVGGAVAGALVGNVATKAAILSGKVSPIAGSVIGAGLGTGAAILSQKGLATRTLRKREAERMDAAKASKQLSARLDAILNFDYGDDDNDPDKKRSIASTVGTGVIGAGLVGGGLYAAGKMAPVSAGGQGLSPMGAARDLKYNLGHLAEGGASRLGSNIAQGGKVAYNTGKSAISALLGKLKGLRP